MVSLLVLIQCSSDSVEEPAPVQATPYELIYPDYFTDPVIPSFNPTTVEGVKLGHMLYYDPILSTNGLTCSSCHQPEKSFSSGIFLNTKGHSISVPPHINLAWNPDFDWSGAQKILDHVALGDFGPEFFNTDFPLLVQKLKAHPDYPELFLKAFGVNDVAQLTTENLKLKISYALTQFMRTQISSNSTFDKFARHELSLSPEEMNGYIIYYTEKGDCFHCHGTMLLTNNTFHNTGLDTVFTNGNEGLYAVTGDPNDLGKFSAPTLRNIELTAPYMHDGRFQTLEEVIEFYNSGVHLNAKNIDPLMTKATKLNGLQLNPQEKANLIAFLKTFTDTSFINNPAFTNPH